MAGGKETPRQKMIGMMYLVLTALLALNVSKDILDAFVVMNNGLEKTDENFTKNNQALYAALKDALSTEKQRAQVPYDNSLKVKQWTEELYKMIEGIKSELIVAEDQVPKEVADTINLKWVNSKDKYDNSTRIMCGETGTGGRAAELKAKINDFKKKMLSVLDPKVAAKTNLGLDTSDPPSTGVERSSWENDKFYHYPLAAQVSVLSQIQTEVRNAEGTVLNELVKSIGARTIKVDKLAAQMIPSANIVTVGEEFSAKIFVAAFNSTMTPDVTVNGAKISTVDETGAVIYKARPGKEGPQKITAIARFINADGQPEESKVEYEYNAVAPVAVVSPDQMNVFYIGVDNPVSISVPGSDPNKIEATLTGGANGSLKKTAPGKYVANLVSGSKCAVAVTVKNAEGKTVNMGTKEFRIKPIPDPIPTVQGKKTGSNISKNDLSGGFLAAILENFDFRASFKVTSFEISGSVNGSNRSETVQGFDISSSPGAVKLINSMKSGQKVYFDIKAVGPDKRPRDLSAVFKIM